ncbi:MAG: DUF177 domain-containing protein [Legionellales bacterium]|nr:DUF177 domain-containing protein [Legionellales bacterium]
MVDIPYKLNPYRLAKQARRFSGEMSLNTMQRLNDIYLQEEKKIVYIDLKFEYDSENICIIKGHFNVDLIMACQRCMQEMKVLVSDDFILSPSNLEQDMAQDKYEPVALEFNNIDVKKMIEDEILLRLPYFPKHANDNHCQIS